MNFISVFNLITKYLWKLRSKFGRSFPETMAIEIDRFIHDLNPDPTVGQEFSSCCHRHGIKQVIDLDVLSSSDMCELCEGCSVEALTFAAAAQAAAKSLAQGWTRRSILNAERAVSELTVAAPSAPRAMPALLNTPNSSTPCRRRIESSVQAVTKRVLTGFRPDTPVGAHGIRNTASTRASQMAKAIRGAEEVFKKYL